MAQADDSATKVWHLSDDLHASRTMAPRLPFLKRVLGTAFELVMDCIRTQISSARANESGRKAEPLLDTITSFGCVRFFSLASSKRHLDSPCKSAIGRGWRSLSTSSLEA